jgi:glycosyltransferase involved in cell wall biosynthesis
MSKPNLLFFIFRLHGGGAERMVSNLSTDLSAKYEVKIAIFDASEVTYPFGGELLKIQLPFSDNTAENKWWAKAIRLAVLVFKLRTIKKRHKIDVSVSLGEQANIINILSGTAKKNVLSVRTLLSEQILDFNHSGILTTFVRLLYNRAYRVVVPSKLAALDLSRHFNVQPGRLSVIYNYLDEERIDRLSQEKIADPFLQQLFSYPVLLNVGRITRAKGQWLLPALLDRLKKSHPGWKLVIIGEPEEGGTAKQWLADRTAELGLSLYDGLQHWPAVAKDGRLAPADIEAHDVFLIGYQGNPFQYMKQSRLLLFPSLFEGFPNTLLEAMKCGLPVISSDCRSGPREILAPDTDPGYTTDQLETTPYGILAPPLPVENIFTPVPQKTIEEWMKATLLMIQEEDRRAAFIQNGYRRVKDFNREETLRQWEEIIDR